MRKTALRLWILIFGLALPLCACKQELLPKYTYCFFGSFDTITDLTAFAHSESEFQDFAHSIEVRMSELHKIFDIYNDYEGINNLKTVNDNAGVAPVVVPPELLDMVVLAKEWYYRTDKTVNIAMGPVLSIWHDYREMYSGIPDEAVAPDPEKLLEASMLCDIEDVIVDEMNSTIFLAKKGMSLDVGSIAKGYSAQLVADELADSPVQSFLLSAGGNVVTRGAPLDGKRSKWGIGIENPFEDADDSLLDTLFFTDRAAVTSGDYQRFYIVDGEIMGHIISPGTLMPVHNFRSVTVIAEDSGLADLLSTALFILPYEEGLDLILRENNDAVWVFADGTIRATDGARALLEDFGGASAK